MATSTRQTPLNMCFLNCYGFPKNKLLIEDLSRKEDIHVLGLTETWTCPRHAPKLPGYTTFRRDRPSLPRLPPRDAVALLVRSALPAQPLPLPTRFQHIESVACRIQSPTLGDISVCSIYVSPKTTFPTKLIKYLVKTYTCVIMGDFNARHFSF
jgi:hypothetical protein